MDPEFTSTADWQTIFIVTSNLFRFAGLVIVGALSFLISHAIVPSLVITHHLSPRANVVRPVFYGAALVALSFALFSFVVALTHAIAVLSRVYPRWAM